MQRIDKFLKNILVWIAISEFRISAPVVSLAKSESIDQHVYLRGMFKEQIASFYKKNIENDGNNIFGKI